MNVFLTGAAGYIGGAIADALQRTGHTVLGLAHSEKSAKVLQARSMSPLRGDLRDPASISRGAQQADAVIHAATMKSSDMAQVDIAAVEAILTTLAGSRKPFIYTSGCWVLGNSGDTIADEESPTDPPAIVAWRPALERRILAATEHGVHSIVIRPANLYGRAGGTPARLITLAGGERDVDEEDPAPGGHLYQPAAEDGADHRGDRCKSRPGPNRLTTPLLIKRCADDRQAAGNEERAADPLHRTCDDELRNSWRQAAPDRREREDENAQRIDTATPNMVAQGSPNQDKGREKEGVHLHYPLHIRRGGVQVSLEYRQGDIDDGAVNEGHARSKNRRNQYPDSGMWGTGSVNGFRMEDALITRRFHRVDHCLLLYFFMKQPRV
jgi:NAD dependent epimerase/dehydratase family